MDVKMVAPFVDAVFTVLPQLGFQDIRKGNLRLKDELFPRLEVTALIGLSKRLDGNVFYSMNETTAKKVASTMMMGMEVACFDAMAQSAISEMVNMITANAAIGFEKQGIIVDITPPRLLSVADIVAINNKLIAIEILTEAGCIEVNVGINA